MSGTSRAIVFEGPGQPLAARDFRLPTPAGGEMLVAVDCATLCGSDLHTYAGRRETPCPTILGHEMIGRLVELPAGDPPLDLAGHPLAVGDRVTWSLAASCGSCFYCDRGLPQKCERLFKYGHERVDRRHPLSGGLAEHCHLARGTSVVRLPDGLPDEVACPANCATATAAAVLRAAGPLEQSAVLIQGAGMLGLTAAAMARRRGAREVLVVDPDETRLARAARFGATRTVNGSAAASVLADVVAEATSGRGVDAALELCGDPAAVEAGLPLVRIGGRYVLAGSVFPARDVAVTAEAVVRRLLRIEGVHNYTPADLLSAVRFLAHAHAEYPFAELVTARFPLAEAEAAFTHAINAKATRVAVVSQP